MWIKETMDPELTDAQFQLQVLVRLKLHPGRRSDSLAWVTCHASCGSDPRRAHGHLSHGTLAFDMAHGHVGTRFFLCFNFYMSCSSILVGRYSQTSNVKFQHFANLAKDQIQIFKCRASPDISSLPIHKEYGRMPTVCGEIFCVWISQGIKTRHG